MKVLLRKSPINLTINQKVIAITIVLFMYDIWLGMLSYLIEVIFEFMEYNLEEIAQEMLGVGHHVSEIIVLNLFLAIALCSLVYLWIASPRIYDYLSDIGEGFRRQFMGFWYTLRLLEKIKLSLTYLLIGSTFITFLFV
ncbi:MAG: hypothetical protein Q9M50_09925 [Methylococcales bacterium]|nr:hypothetical protein [Methylococcales bacterium]